MREQLANSDRALVPSARTPASTTRPSASRSSCSRSRRSEITTADAPLLLENTGKSASFSMPWARSSDALAADMHGQLGAIGGIGVTEALERFDDGLECRHDPTAIRVIQRLRPARAVLRITRVHDAVLPAVRDGRPGCSGRPLRGDHRHVCLGRGPWRAGGDPEPAPRLGRRLPPVARPAGCGHRGQDEHAAHHGRRPAPRAVRAREAGRGSRRGRPDQPRPGVLRRRDRLPGRGVRHVRCRPSRPGPSRRGAHRAAAAPVVRRATRPRRAHGPRDATALHARWPDARLRRRHRGGRSTGGPPRSDVLGRVARHHAGGGLPRRRRATPRPAASSHRPACRTPSSSPTTPSGPGPRSASTCSSTPSATQGGTPTGRAPCRSHARRPSPRWPPRRAPTRSSPRRGPGPHGRGQRARTAAARRRDTPRPGLALPRGRGGGIGALSACSRDGLGWRRGATGQLPPVRPPRRPRSTSASISSGGTLSSARISRVCSPT